MGKTWTFETVESWLKDNQLNYQLVDMSYKRNHVLYVTLYCEKHNNLFTIKWDTYKNRKIWCKICNDEEKYDLEKYQKIINSIITGYTVLDYKKVNSKLFLLIKCNNPEHPPYWAYWNHLKNGHLCSECQNNKRKNTDIFKNQLEKITNDYEVVGEYINAITPIKIRHKTCGSIYDVTPNRFLNGNRCPYCNSSNGEKIVSEVLDLFGIYYIRQFRFKDCIDIRSLPFDFYLPNNNICIEFQGEQHYYPIEKFGGEEGFEILKKHDKIKKEYCQKNGILLIEIDFHQINKIYDIIKTEVIEFGIDKSEFK